MNKYTVIADNLKDPYKKSLKFTNTMYAKYTVILEVPVLILTLNCMYLDCNSQDIIVSTL